MQGIQLGLQFAAPITPAREIEPLRALQPPSQPTDAAIATGDKAKARDILAAIRMLKQLEGDHRAATKDERLILARYPGFGPVALSIFPNPITGRYKDASWQALGEELRLLLTDEEYASAKRTTFNAFYTSSTVIRAMFQALKRLGVPDDGLVLEPGCGPGRFLYMAPKGMRFIGVELDSVSGRIARALHPGADIRIENFRDSRLPALDACVGNVPFADIKLEHRGQRFSLHDYFFAKSVDSLKPGGVLALVTSHFTLDKVNAAIREYLAERADFVGAIRLPSDAFKREGTSVVTDIVFLRKRDAGEPARHADPDWLTVAPLSIDGAECSINRYFLNHPEMVLGTWSRKDTLYGEGYSVTGNGDLAQQLCEAVERLPELAPFQPSAVIEHPAVSSRRSPCPGEARWVGEGGFFIDEHRAIQQIVDGQAVPVVYGGTALTAYATMTGRRLAALIGLRDRARRVLRSQNEGWPELDRNDARRELNYAYDRFVDAYGPINKTTFSETKDETQIRRMPNIVKFREDPDAMLVLALEDYDEVTEKAAKAAIMSRDVVGRTPAITRVNSAEEGLLVALNQRGQVDLPFIATLYGKPEEQITSELGDLIYRDPASKEWQTADAYLSGNVRAKLKAAEAAGPEYARNADALRAVQPEDVLPGDIDANLGAPWIPEADVQAFAAHLFNVEPDAVPVAHLVKDAVWSIEPSYSALQSVAAVSEYGTPRIGGITLLEQALNMKTPTIYDPDPADPDKRVVNPVETQKAREKQKQIKEKFKAWVFTDPDRTERLVRLYNDAFNNLRPRLFDGSHLDFPGMSEAFTLRQHQKDAVWRGMSGGNTLLAHVVGAGKSAVMAATAMKMKQAGLTKKPLCVVPNHLLEQFAREFQSVYPNAKLLVAGKEDFTRERRKILTAKIASGDWDAIIVTHSSFERIGMSRDYQAQFLREQIAEYEELICESAAAKSDRAQRNILKTLEKQKASREEKLTELLAEDKKDDGLVFDELGVDHIFIDEAQEFKNLETPTKMERVAGIQTDGSQRAFDLYMKCRYLHRQHPGHGVSFATGTPISNTMVELYTMSRYLDPEGLKSRGIDHFDAWAATFGEVVEKMEISPDGKTLKPRTRFANFVNLPELQQMFRAFADVQTADMLNLPRPRLESGKAIVIACPMSDDQAALQQELVERYERIRSTKVDPREDNALKITTDGRKLALDARMLSPEAKDCPESKINALVANVSRIWKETADKRLTQMIFCDMGVNPTEWGFSAYDEVLEKLAAAGIPRSEIAVIGEADSDAKKAALFAKVRSGQVRVLIGSTKKMGTGTNVQKRLVALHHLDAPWKPAEIEQREGRILRQGNSNEEVAVYRYVTEGSFDAYMWQTLETKARFINQVMTGDNTLRRAEDVGSQELSYAEVKAIASGNPAVLTLAEADAEVQRLGILKKNHADEQYLARKNLKELPERIDWMTKRLAGLTDDQSNMKVQAGGDLIIGSRHVAREDAVEALAERMESLPQRVMQIKRVPLGVYRGLYFGMILHPLFAPEVYLEGSATRQDRLSRDHHGPRALLFELDTLQIGLYGTLRLGFPTVDDAHILRIRASIEALIDQRARFVRASITLTDALLFESVHLTGGAAFLLDWGKPNFALTLGGFHPAFRPFIPPQLREPPRIGAFWKPHELVELSIQAYIARTLTSFQFGFSAHLKAGASWGGIRGDAEFNFLVMIAPELRFEVDLSFRVTAFLFGADLISASFRGALSGPCRWHFEGSISWEVCGVSIGKDLGPYEWGDPPRLSSTQQEARQLLGDALAQPQNWTITRSPRVPVRVRASVPDALDPRDQIDIRQTQLPLGIDIEVNDANPLADRGTWTLRTTTTTLITVSTLTDVFPTRRYLQKPPKEAPFRGGLTSGIRVGGAGWTLRDDAAVSSDEELTEDLVVDSLPVRPARSKTEVRLPFDRAIRVAAPTLSVERKWTRHVLLLESAS